MFLRKLLKDKLKFYIVRTGLVLFAVLAIIDFIFFRERWFILAGLAAGCLMSIVRLHATDRLITRQACMDKPQVPARRRAFAYTVVQLATLLFLGVFAVVNVPVFLGAAAGILLVPLSVIINTIAEAFGFMHNPFKQRR